MKWLILTLMYFSTVAYGHDFIVVTSEETKLEKMSAFQLKQVYLGKIIRLKGEKLTPLQVKRKDPLRHMFEDEVFEEHFDIDNYWLSRKLDAAAEPPRTVGSWALVLAYVERNPGFIGYIPKDKLSELSGRKVKVLEIEP